jgi:ABC-type glycerol-3-phosphate transport system permease component
MYLFIFLFLMLWLNFLIPVIVITDVQMKSSSSCIDFLNKSEKGMMPSLIDVSCVLRV